MELAAGEGGLQDVARIHGALGGAGTHDEVQLVDEQDDLAVGLLDLLEHRLQAVLELAAVLGAGDERAHVELDDVLVADGGRHVARDDALGEALHDGGLADARLADEHGVVLGAAREDLDRAADLLHAAHDRVELALAGEVGDVAAVLLERLELRLGVLAGHAVVAAQGGVRLLDALARDAERAEHVARIALVIGERAEQVLGGDVGVAQLGGELLGRLGHAHEIAAGRDHAHRAAHLGLARDDGVDLRLEQLGVGTHALDDGADVAFPAREQGLEQMYRLDRAGLRVGSDAHRRLQRLLCGDRPFIDSHMITP